MKKSMVYTAIFLISILFLYGCSNNNAISNNENAISNNENSNTLEIKQVNKTGPVDLKGTEYTDPDEFYKSLKNLELIIKDIPQTIEEVKVVLLFDRELYNNTYNDFVPTQLGGRGVAFEDVTWRNEMLTSLENLKILLNKIDIPMFYTNYRTVFDSPSSHFDDLININYSLHSVYNAKLSYIQSTDNLIDVFNNNEDLKSFNLKFDSFSRSTEELRGTTARLITAKENYY